MSEANIGTARLLVADENRVNRLLLTRTLGIAPGDMIAGYAGTNDRATYTCIGDTVNLASRLEAHTKLAKRPILIGGATRAALGNRIAVESLRPIEVKGKSAPVEVFAVAVEK